MSPLDKIPVLYLMVAAVVVSESTKCGPDEFACADGSRSVGVCSQRFLLKSTRVGFSDSGPTLNLVQGRSKQVIHGPNGAESNLLYHEETTDMVSCLHLGIGSV